MRFLVTGGAGYLGCCLVPQLLERGFSVRLFDRLCFGEDPISQFASSEIEVIRGDVRRLQEHKGLLDDVDVVIHLAALSNDPSCDLDAEMARDVNVESTKELVNLAVQSGVERFVLASSCGVYGKGVFAVLDEKSPTNPVSTYAASCLEAERAVLALQSGSFAPVVARLSTLYGWSPRMRFDLAVNQMVATATRNGRIMIMGGGEQWRPFMHVGDAARALIEIATTHAEKVSGEIFNVGASDGNYRIIDLAKHVADALQNVEIEPAKGDDDVRSYRVLFDKLHDALEFKAQHSIEDGISELKEKLEDASLDPSDEQYYNVRRMKRLLDTPVDEGGEPVAAHFIPLARPMIGIEEERVVVEALRSGWITSGPQIKAFEEAFAETVSAPYAVAVNSCTSALHLCLVHLGVGPGDEVITSPLTWSSTANTVLNMGAKPVFADVQYDTLNINPDAIEKAITERTKVIMPVHLAGQPCDMDAIRSIAEKHGVAVVEDAAHAPGAAYKGTPIGNYSDMTCFSFYAIKNITTMEGGIAAVKDEDVAANLRLLASNGMQATAWDRYGRSALVSPPEVVQPGYKYLMGNVSAAMGVEQLKKFDSFKAARKRLAKMYNTVLPELDEIRVPRIIDDVEHAWHLMIVCLKLDKLKKNREEIAYALRRENVGTGFHFWGLHLHRYYEESLGLKPEDLPNATRVSKEVLSLPLWPGMSDKNVHEVVAALKKVIYYSR